MYESSLLKMSKSSLVSSKRKSLYGMNKLDVLLGHSIHFVFKNKGRMYSPSPQSLSLSVENSN